MRIKPITSDNFNELAEALNRMTEEQSGKAKKINEKRNTKWWNNLSSDDKLEAVYAVTSRIAKAYDDDISYRDLLYKELKLEPTAYNATRDAGLFDLLEVLKEADYLDDLHNVSRLEVIDDEGRTYVKGANKIEEVHFVLQDDNKTLKIFINTEIPDESKY